MIINMIYHFIINIKGTNLREIFPKFGFSLIKCNMVFNQVFFLQKSLTYLILYFVQIVFGFDNPFALEPFGY